jgi:flagellar biosynthetic protein FliQ
MLWDISTVMDTLRAGIGVAVKICAPMLILSMLVGVVVAVFQAVTQIHEQTISFILKLAVVVGVLLIGGSWMLGSLQEYTLELYALISG